ERPARPTPRIYGDVLALADALVPATIRQGERLHVDLWWSALKPLPLDYTAGVFLLDSQGNVRAQHDGPPGDTPTTQWPLNRLVFDRHTLSIARDLPPGLYRIGVQVYWYGDRIPLGVGGEKYAVVSEIQVEG